MVDLDFIEFALSEKRHQITLASPKELSRLTRECNELLRILAEDDGQRSRLRGCQCQ